MSAFSRLLRSSGALAASRFMMRLALIPALLMGGQALAYRPLSTVEQLELQ